MQQRSVVTFLVVDDDDVAGEFVARSMRANGFTGPMFVESDPREALAILRGERPDKHIERPYVILLDLNMPVMSGFEFLDVLHADPDLADSVVFVLSTSDDVGDIERAYEEQVAGYIVKPSGKSEFGAISAMLERFAETVTLPG